MFDCNLPPALLAEWPQSFTCYCGNIWVVGVLTTELSPLLLIERYQSTPEVLASNVADVTVL